MRSPTIIAGLRRIATSLWLRFVASPQRVPVVGHRRRGRPVVNVIYKVPPTVSYYNIGEILQSADLSLWPLARATEPTQYAGHPVHGRSPWRARRHRPAFGSPFSSWHPAWAG